MAPISIGAEQVADLLSVRPSTIMDLHRRHELRGFRVARYVRFLSGDVIRYLARQHRASGHKPRVVADED